MRLLTGANQEHLGCVSPERPVGRGLLLGLRNIDSDRKPLPWGLCGEQDGKGYLARGERERLSGFGCHLGRGGALSPAERICGPAEFLPAGVGLCAAHHPGHRDGLPGGGGCAAGHLPPGPISGGHGTDPREGNHQSAGQTCWDSPP